MKTSIRPLIAFFFSALLFFQGCTVYRSANITLEEAAKKRTDVKITTHDNHVYTFSKVKFEEGEYYGYRNVSLKNNGKYKVHVIEENVAKIQLKDGNKSNTMNFSKIDFARNTKSITGLIVMVISMYATYNDLDVNLPELETTVASIFVSIGALYASFGLIMKLFRK